MDGLRYSRGCELERNSRHEQREKSREAWGKHERSPREREKSPFQIWKAVTGYWCLFFE